MDVILWGYHSNKNSLAKLSRDIIYFPRIYKKEFWIFVSLLHCLLLRMKRLEFMQKEADPEKYHTRLSII